MVTTTIVNSCFQCGDKFPKPRKFIQGDQHRSTQCDKCFLIQKKFTCAYCHREFHYFGISQRTWGSEWCIDCTKDPKRFMQNKMKK